MQLLDGVTVITTNANISGTLTVTNGFASYSSNKVALASITVTASPFNWTNTLSKNVVVYTYGITGSAAINGTTYTSSLTALDAAPAFLQPGEWVTVTYTVAPTMVWKPF